MVKQYRIKTPTEAIQWTVSYETYHEMRNFTGEFETNNKTVPGRVFDYIQSSNQGLLLRHHLRPIEEQTWVNVFSGDWVVKGPHGFFVITNEEFIEFYEEV